MRVLARLRHFLRLLDLRGKLTLALLAAALGIGGIVTLSSFFIARHQLTEHTRELLEARALIERREIELRLGNIVALAGSLAANTVTANALADSRGREIYLDPLLRNQNLDIPGASLGVLDYRGRPAASTEASPADFGSDEDFREMMASGRPAVRLSDDGSLLRVVLPIRYRLTGNTEGGVLLQVPLAPLLGSSRWADSHWLADRSGRLLAGRRLAGDALEMPAALQLPPPLDTLGLRLMLARDRDEVFRALDLLLLVFVVIGIGIVIGVVVFARVGARHITAPLGQIAGAAEEIAASGRPTARLPVGRADEFGRLSAAFNTMVDRLRQSYGELEDLVAERTRDYEESQQEAERASQLLREAVQSIAVGFTVYDENDCLLTCNEAYLRLYEESRDLIVPGASFAEIVRRGAERGQYREANGNIDAWVAQRVALHRQADGTPIEQRLGNGRWLLIIEHRTPSGYIVGNRIDITELKNATAALEMREAYQRATLDNLPFLFWLKDAEGRFLAVNKVFADACGRAGPEAVVGLSDFDVWPRALAERYCADDRAVMASRREHAVEEPVAGGASDGWVETYKKPVIAADGSLLGTVGFARDISERKRMERALEESEQRWELAVRGANDGVWDWHPGSDEAFFSDRWKSMLGYAPEEIGGRVEEWRSRLHPDDAGRVAADLRRHFAGETEFYQSEFRLRCKDGSYKWILSRGKALFGDSGQPIRMSGSHTDISERRLAEAGIRDRTEQLNAIFALSPDGFVSFDAGGRVKYASAAFMHMTGFGEAEIVGLDEANFSARLAAACRGPARFPGVAALLAAQRAASGVAGTRQLIEIAGPGQRVLEVGVRESEAESVSRILYFRDVTHETEVDRMKSEFLSTAAHELRTPMASIYGFSELMLVKEFSPEEEREFLTAIYRQSELMVSIVNELLDLARIDARRGKDFQFSRIDAGELLREVVAGFKTPAGREPPAMPASAPPCWLRADRKKLSQALGNVLANAYKYSPAGGPVSIELLGPERSGEECEGGAARAGIRIVDRGIGMTPAQLRRVCERFYRADTSGKIPGTGLGMSIVKEIVELHGGEIELASEAGAGTAVTLWLPAAAAGS